jgi:DNA repair protein RecO (recombination protein O)
VAAPGLSPFGMTPFGMPPSSLLPAGLSQPGAAPLAAALRAFELCLLRESGLLPELDRVTLTQLPLDTARDAARPRYALRPEAGLVDLWHAADIDEHASDDAVDDEGLSAWQCHALEAALQAGDLPGLQALCLHRPAALKRQLRRSLHYHFGDRALRTRQVMVEVQRLLGGLRPAAR